MSTMTCKGYAARIEYSEEDGCFVGHLARIRDIVGFDGNTVAQLKKRFHEAVDDYLWGYEQLGTLPNKPFSGRLLLRVPVNLHARASVAAKVTGMSLNQWLTRAVEHAVERR